MKVPPTTPYRVNGDFDGPEIERVRFTDPASETRSVDFKRLSNDLKKQGVKLTPRQERILESKMHETASKFREFLLKRDTK